MQNLKILNFNFNWFHFKYEGMRTILSSSRQRLPVSNRNSSNQNLQHHSDSDSGQSSADSVSGQITASNNEGNPVRNEIGWNEI